MAMALTEEHIIYVRKYIDLTETVEEAFQYILNKETIRQPEAIQDMMPDILAAFEQINVSNEQLLKLFPGHLILQQRVNAFQQLIHQMETDIVMEMKLFDPALIERTARTYFNWKSLMSRDLLKRVYQ